MHICYCSLHDDLVNNNLYDQVKPVIKLLKQTLVGTGVLLVTAASLFIFADPVQNFIRPTSALKEKSSSMLSPSTKISMRCPSFFMLETPF